MNKTIKNFVLSALFLALGMILPLITGQIQQIGIMLLPMHLPIFLCSLICGYKYGLIVGFILPFWRFLIFGMPPLYPTAVAMAFELSSYGFFTGFIYEHSKYKCIISLYKALIISMILGRIIWGIAEVILLGINGSKFTFQMFIAGAFLNSFIGIIIQLIIIPIIMLSLNKTGLVHFNKNK